MILSASAGYRAVIDGVSRAVVIAGETTGAVAVMEPLGRRTLNIVDGTDRLAFTTFDADIGVDRKLAVCYHVTVEVASQYIGIESGSSTSFEFDDARATCVDGLDDVNHLSAGLGNLAFFFRLRVGVHKRQADIRFWHDK